MRCLCIISFERKDLYHSGWTNFTWVLLCTTSLLDLQIRPNHQRPQRQGLRIPTNISATLPPVVLSPLLSRRLFLFPPFLHSSVAHTLSVTLSVCSIIISMVTIKDVKLSPMYYGSNLSLSSHPSLLLLLMLCCYTSLTFQSLHV